MQISRLCLAASLAAITSVGPAFAAEDVGAGQEIYQAQCSACHSNQPGVNGIGPSLAGVAGRKAGSLQGFHYTPAMQWLGADLGCQDLHPVPGRPDQARAGHGDDGHGAGRDGTSKSVRLSRNAQGHDRRDEADRPGGAQDHRSHAGRSRRRRGGDRRVALRLARLCRHALRRSQSDHAGKRQEPPPRLPLPL